MKPNDKLKSLMQDIDEIYNQIQKSMEEDKLTFGDECIEWAQGGVDGITAETIDNIETFIGMIDEFGGDESKVLYALGLLERASENMDSEEKIKIIMAASELLNLNPVMMEDN